MTRGGTAEDAPAASAPAPPPVVEPAAARPPARAESPAEAELRAARAQLGAVLHAFAAWAKDNPSAPCPTARELAPLVRGGIVDPWGKPIELTCTDQPGDQMMGASSLGPDGVPSGDDLASWTLGADVTGIVRGKRWRPPAVAAPSRPRRSAAGRAPPARPRAALSARPTASAGTAPSRR